MRTMRAAARAALWLLVPTVLSAQGMSPWVEAVNELQAQFTGLIARRLSLIAIVVSGLMASLKVGELAAMLVSGSGSVGSGMMAFVIRGGGRVAAARSPTPGG